MKRREFLKTVPVGVIGGIVGGAIALQTDDVLIMGDTHYGRERENTLKAMGELAEQINRNPPASYMLVDLVKLPTDPRTGNVWVDTISHNRYEFRDGRFMVVDKLYGLV